MQIALHNILVCVCVLVCIGMVYKKNTKLVVNKFAKHVKLIN